jgi:mono/diheme cytochrome c family protein
MTATLTGDRANVFVARAHGAEPANAFDGIVRVLKHPRCLNCHVSGETPGQGDEGRPHRPPVRRGAAGTGVAGQRCAACHGARNNAASTVPGAANWQLPRPSMGWEALGPGALCRAIKDPAQNG